VRGRLGQTPLHDVVCDFEIDHESGLQGTKSVVSLLLHAGADIRKRDHDGKTPLHVCCPSFLEDCVGLVFLEESLLDQVRQAIRIQDKQANTPLHYHLFRTTYNRIESDIFMREDGTFLQHNLAFLRKMLQIASSSPDIYSVHKLLRKLNKDGLKPLDAIEIALDENTLQSDRYDDLRNRWVLLESGVPLLEQYGELFDRPRIFTSMAWIALKYYGIVRTDLENHDSYTSAEMRQAFEKMLEMGAEIDYVHPMNGFTFLHVWLDRCPNDQNRKDNEDCLWKELEPMEPFRGERGRAFALDWVDYFANHQFTNWGTVSNTGFTLLHVAAHRGFVEVCARLLELEPNLRCLLDAQDDDGFTPLHLACTRGHL
jgi:ankyrin repeat protein